MVEGLTGFSVDIGHESTGKVQPAFAKRSTQSEKGRHLKVNGSVGRQEAGEVYSYLQ